MSDTLNIKWTPKGADPDAWRKVVMLAKVTVEEFIEHRMAMTPKAWYEMSLDEEWQNTPERDDVMTRFAWDVFDNPPAPDELHPTLMKVGEKMALEYGYATDESDDEELQWSAAERIWYEAIDTAEDMIQEEAGA